MPPLPPIAQWQVYFDSACRYTTPVKPKFLVVACTESVHAWCFVVNSKINTFVENHPDLYPCMVPITKADHRFLDHDSLINCQKAYDYARHELMIHRGVLSAPCAAHVLKSILLCPTLQERIKEMMQEQAGV